MKYIFEEQGRVLSGGGHKFTYAHVNCHLQFFTPFLYQHEKNM